MADVDATLEQQILDIVQRQREPHLHHDHQGDHLGRRVEVAKWTGGFAGGAAWRGSHCHRPMPPVGSIALTEPSASLLNRFNADRHLVDLQTFKERRLAALA